VSCHGTFTVVLAERPSNLLFEEIERLWSGEGAPTFFSLFLPKSATFTSCCPVRTFPSLIYFQA
jgi:hypothetical protein